MVIRQGLGDPIVGQVADGDHVEVVDVTRRRGGPGVGRATAGPLMGASELFEDGEFRSPATSFDQ